MTQTVVELALAPLLVAVSSLVARRRGPHLGGVVSAFPAIVGPLLMILAIEHGRVFAARAAGGTLLGLTVLSAFSLVYGRSATRSSWRVSLLSGWACAACAAVIIEVTAPHISRLGLPAAVASLAIARLALPSPRAGIRVVDSPEQVVPTRVRMALAALLVTVLSAGAGAFGPLVGGMLASLPVLASVLAVCTHRESGGHCAVALLRGMLAGMAGFVVFCEVLSVLLARGGVPSAFAAATAAAVVVQALTVYGHPGRAVFARRRVTAAGADRVAANREGWAPGHSLSWSSGGRTDG